MKFNLRKALGLLQILPFILIIPVIINYILDSFNLSICGFIYPLFGFSFVLCVILHKISKYLCLSLWNRLLYVVMEIISIFELFDNIFCLSYESTLFQEFIIIILVLGVTSSFITYLYEKFKK